MTSLLLRATWPARAARAGPYPYFGQDAKACECVQNGWHCRPECGVRSSPSGPSCGLLFPFPKPPRLCSEMPPLLLGYFFCWGNSCHYGTFSTPGVLNCH